MSRSRGEPAEPLKARVRTPKATHAIKCQGGRGPCTCDKAEVDHLLAKWWALHALDLADDIGISYNHVTDKWADVFQ